MQGFIDMTTLPHMALANAVTVWLFCPSVTFRVFRGE